MTDAVTSSYQVIQFKGPELPECYTSLIYSKWLRSLRYGNDYFKLIEPDSYYKTYNKHIEFILTRPNAVIRLAVLADDHDVVLGFSVVRDNILDYVHVHKDQRRQGIGTALVPSGISTITHLTKIALAIWPDHPNWDFNPFI